MSYLRFKGTNKIVELTNEADERGICQVLDHSSNEVYLAVFADLEPIEAIRSEEKARIDWKIVEMKRRNEELKAIYNEGTTWNI